MDRGMLHVVRADEAGANVGLDISLIGSTLEGHVGSANEREQDGAGSGAAIAVEGTRGGYRLLEQEVVRCRNEIFDVRQGAAGHSGRNTELKVLSLRALVYLLYGSQHSALHSESIVSVSASDELSEDSAVVRLRDQVLSEGEE
jgi:hypothetical protein